MKVLLFKLVLFVLLLAPAGSGAAESRNLMLILDSSGSMWGQIEGEAKASIARDALSTIVDAVPAEFTTGLIAYGHRRKGDCADIELLIPPGPHDPAAMKERIAELKPRGKTPLSASLQMAARTLRSTEEPASVILLTDGLETCDADPCQVAAELAMSGVDFTVHVIGFDLSKGDQSRVRCIADKTGGLFVGADDAQALRQALDRTVAKVQEAPAPLVEDPGAATLEAPPQVTVGDRFSVRWQGPGSKDDHICLATPKKDDTLCLDHAYIEQGNPLQLAARAKPGQYELRYVHAHSNAIIGRRPIAIVAAQAEVQAPKTADAASPVQVSWKGPGHESDYIAIAAADQQEHSYHTYAYTAEGNPLKVQAPSAPGTYEIRYVLGTGDMVLAKTLIEIRPVTAKVTAQQSVDAAAPLAVQWQGPGNENDYISIAGEDEESGDYLAYAYVGEGNTVQLTAPSKPGNYEVRYVLGQDDVVLARQKVQVDAVAAQLHAPEKVDAAATFDVQWQGPGNSSDYVSIAASQAGDDDYLTYAYVVDGNTVQLTAPSKPGPYEVRYVLGQDDVVLARRFLQVSAVSASVKAPAAAPMGAIVEVKWQGPSSDGDYIAVAAPEADESGYIHYQYTAEGNPADLRVPTQPGMYEIRYVLGQDNVVLARQKIEITPVAAGVKGPAKAAPASQIEVQWQGPDAESDFIAIAEEGSEGSSYITYEYTTAGSPLSIDVPEEPGTYEIRYVLGEGEKVMATAPLEVK